jgi:Ala-tRNA(Pro) deacylase
MSIPERLWTFLAASAAQYDIVEHRHSRCSAGTARTAGVPPHQLVKSVVLEDDGGCLVALVPADRSVQLGRVAQLLNRSHLHLADEAHLASMFAGCESGAVPGLGMAWGLDTVVDDELEACDWVFLECGDHERLLRLSHAQFHALVRQAPHGAISGARLH